MADLVGGSIVWNLDVDSKKYDDGLDRARQNASKAGAEIDKSLSGSLKNAGDNLEQFGGNLARLGTPLAAIGGITALLTKGFIDQAGAMEQNQVAFSTMLGDAGKANALIEQMTRFAAQTPFQLPDVIAAGKQLLAYGTEAKDVINVQRMLGDVAAGVGQPIGDLVYLYGTLQVQQRAYTKDLVQFTNRGIDVLTPLAKQFGVTKDEVFGLASEGKISFAEIEKAFQSMTGEGGKFFNLMDKQSKTAGGKISNFGDAIIRLQTAIGTALLPAVKNLLDFATPLLDSFGRFARENQTLVTILVALGLGIGALGIAIVGLGIIFLSIGAILSGLGAIAAVSGTIMAVAFAPITLIVLAIIAVIGLLFLAWNTNFLGIQDIVGSFVSYLTGTVWPAVQRVFNYIGAILTTIGQIFTNIFNLIIKPLLKLFVDYLYVSFWLPIKLVFDLMTKALESMGTSWSEVWEGIKQIVFTILGAIVNEVKSRINTVVSAINALISGANAIGGKVKGYTNINTIPMLAKGVTNFTGGLAIVGERGPELVNLPRGSDVIPNGDFGRGTSVTHAPVINITLGNFIGTEAEKRKFAYDMQVALDQYYKGRGRE